jgi:hypothetical protein
MLANLLLCLCRPGAPFPVYLGWGMSACVRCAVPCHSANNHSISYIFTRPQEVPLTKAGTTLGRSPAADVLLDHGSISRQHAAVCYNPATSTFSLLDLGSVHGTWADGQPARNGVAAVLRPGSEVQLGASTRRYVLRWRGTQGAGMAASLQDQQQHHVADEARSAHPPWARLDAAGAGEEATGAAPSMHKRTVEGMAGGQAQQGQRPEEGGSSPGQGKEAKRPRVRFADGGEGGGGGLEQVIGYSERGSSFSLVGPRPVVEGKFGSLVTSTTLLEHRIGQQQAGAPGADEAAGLSGRAARPSPAAQLGGRGGIGHSASAGKGVRSAMVLFTKQLQEGRQHNGTAQQAQQQEADHGAAAGRSVLFGDLPPPKNT